MRTANKTDTASWRIGNPYRTLKSRAGSSHQMPLGAKYGFLFMLDSRRYQILLIVHIAEKRFRTGLGLPRTELLDFASMFLFYENELGLNSISIPKAPHKEHKRKNVMIHLTWYWDSA